MLARPSLSGTEEFDAGMDAMEAISGRRHRLGSTIPNSTQLAGLKLTSLLVCFFLCGDFMAWWQAVALDLDLGPSTGPLRANSKLFTFNFTLLL